jgi:hypothetical protein
MAQRHIERSERGVWRWVITGLLAFGLIALIISQPERETRRDAAGQVAVDSADGTVIDSAAAAAAAAHARATASRREAASRAVNDYLAFVERNRARDVPDSSHAYTASGIRLLTDALSALAAVDTVNARSIRSQVTWLRARADTLYRDWRSRDQAEHARHARDALIAVADLVQSLHERRYPDIANEAFAVTEAALAVRPDVALLEQRAEVQRFFDRAADAARGMADTRD